MPVTFKVLLIEDDDGKRQSVKTCLEREIEKAERVPKMAFANSVRSAITQLDESKFDLIVADMSLPTFDIGSREAGGTPRAFGGIEVFEYLERIGCSTPVLVVTSYPVISDGSTSVKFEDLGSRLRREFPETFKEIIYFDSAYSEWDRALSNFLATQLR